jgi:hypothetical protein
MFHLIGFFGGLSLRDPKLKESKFGLNRCGIMVSYLLNWFQLAETNRSRDNPVKLTKRDRSARRARTGVLGGETLKKEKKTHFEHLIHVHNTQ